MRWGCCLLVVLAECVACATPQSVAGVPALTAERKLRGEHPVEVTWSDPLQFGEVRRGASPYASLEGDWVVELAEHVRQRGAARLPRGQELTVHFLDVTRAGRVEPWRGPAQDSVHTLDRGAQVRIELRFRRSSSDGQVLAQGQRELVDFPLPETSGSTRSADPLQFEKALLSRWLAQELP